MFILDNGNITQEILRFTFDSLSYYDFKRSDKYYQKKGEELMAMHQAFYKQIDPIQIVLRGAILKCTHSSDNAYTQYFLCNITIIKIRITRIYNLDTITFFLYLMLCMPCQKLGQE